MSFGRTQRPGNGAAAFRTDRLGNRNAFAFDTPPMRYEPEGRRWQAKFADAERFGGLFAVNPPDFDVGTPGLEVTVAADTASGRLVPVTGATPRYAVRAGQWVSFVVDDKRYLDMVVEQVILDASGEGTLRLKNLLRVPLTEGDVVELAQPKIEGSIEFSSPPEWGTDRLIQFSFTVTEDE